MIRMDSRDPVFRLLDCQIASSSAATANVPISLCEGEQTWDRFSLGDWAEGTIPGWDNLWIDLGGEG